MKFSFLIYLKRFLKIYSKFLYTTSASPGQQLFPLTEDVQMLCSIGNDVQESLLKILDNLQHTISCRLGQRKVNVEVSKEVPGVVPAWAESWTIVGLLPVYICQVRLIKHRKFMRVHCGRLATSPGSIPSSQKLTTGINSSSPSDKNSK